MQKTLLSIIIIIVFTPNFASSAEPARSSKPMFKGVELYSWKVSNNAWRFSLCVGTNRNKTLFEIKRHCQKVNNVSSLKNSLPKLAAGEYVMWSSPYTELTLPPEAVLQEVQDHATSRQISLTIAK